MNKNSEHALSDDEYGHVLDHVVVTCVDVLIINENKLLLGKRVNKPNQDWWFFGGRMWIGENFSDTALRGVERETKLLINKKRFKKLGSYNLLWPERNEKPQTKGCHHVLVAMYVEINKDEAEQIILQDDHEDHLWLDLNNEDMPKGKFSPELTSIITDLREKISR